MQFRFTKYHALENDFLVIEAGRRRPAGARLSQLSAQICNRRTGVGADGVVYLDRSRRADRRIDIYNADGSWAEKSGNGLRIAAVHLATGRFRRNRFTFETATSVDTVTVLKRNRDGFMVSAILGEPDFRAERVPVRSRRKYLINSPLRLGAVSLPVTCLSTGNPHAVLVVDNFDFDWQQVGSDIEHSRQFPEGTNVEFVRILSRRKIAVAEWERGVGPTGSSGTGAAAAVCAMVMLGLVDRRCEVVFLPGSMHVHWRQEDNLIEINGPVQFVAQGTFATR